MSVLSPYPPGFSLACDVLQDLPVGALNRLIKGVLERLAQTTITTSSEDVQQILWEGGHKVTLELLNNSVSALQHIFRCSKLRLLSRWFTTIPCYHLSEQSARHL
ncbi:hypothetical protein CYMTET_19431 [Cymbomonas tetramitiformis]|uniref:Uncharacterized protein n=1 Tax=Cymbomonas tetramitiformis TaxID=36881 RepID=A0AAE0G610_9CHLO|nr:hypothetical protein CYMTET_19431 [Cymbomonas tetramitiformis]